jgi:hypothetical protein
MAPSLKRRQITFCNKFITRSILTMRIMKKTIIMYYKGMPTYSPKKPSLRDCRCHMITLNAGFVKWMRHSLSYVLRRPIYDKLNVISFAYFPSLVLETPCQIIHQILLTLHHINQPSLPKKQRLHYLLHPLSLLKKIVSPLTHPLTST